MEPEATAVDEPTRQAPVVDPVQTPAPADSTSDTPFDQGKYAEMLDGIRDGTIQLAETPQATEPEPQKQAEPEPTKESEHDDDDEVAPPQDKGPPKNYRLKPRSEADRKLFEAYKSSDKPLAELLAASQPQPQANAEPQVSDVPPTKSPVQELDERIAEVRQRLSEEDQAFDTAKAFLSAAELGALQAERKMLQAQEAKLAEQAARSQFDAAWDSSLAKASEMYGAALQEPSFGEMMKRIDDDLALNNDPLFLSADKPRIIAQMAARELGIAPKSSQQPGTQPPQAPKPTYKPRPAQGGHVSPPTTAPLDLRAVMRTPDDYERMRNAFLQSA